MADEIIALGKRSVVPNLLKRKMARGELAFTYLTYLIPRHEMVGFTANCGYDGLVIDLEHGTINLDEAAWMSCSAMAEGVTPLVRVPSATFDWIGRALEFGAQGVIVPQVQTAAEAREVVKHAKYPPYGIRSIGAALPSLKYENLPFELTGQLLNDETVTVVIIETIQSVENINEIARVPGLDVLMIGTPDLLGDMGLDGQLEHPRLQAAVGTICEAAIAANKDGANVMVGIGGLTGRLDLLEKYCKLYPIVRYATAGADGGMLHSAMKARAAQTQKVAASVAAHAKGK